MEERVGSFTVVKRGGKEELIPNMKDPAMAERKKNADRAAADAKKKAEAAAKAAAAEAKKEAKTAEKAAGAPKEVK